MLVTTSYHPKQEMIYRAKEYTERLNGIYVEREKWSIKGLMEAYQQDEMVIIEQNRTIYMTAYADHPFFFHPSMALIRINRLKQGDNDVMVQMADLKQGDSFLDCTMGLATDSIVASYAVGETGKVVSLESETLLAMLVKDGLSQGWKNDIEIDQAMKRIDVKNINHEEGLQLLPDNSFDIVYFDPMFRTGMMKSSSINPMRNLANHHPITEEAISEAKRVARRKVVLKENRKSGEFERLGFQPLSRSSSVTYGYINVNGSVVTL